MRPKHTQHQLASFPVYSCAFLSERSLVIGGGGGASRSGIKNKLRLYEVTEDRQIEQRAEFELDKGEDAPMSLAAHPESKTVVCGINSTEENLLKGINHNCRAFSVGDTIISLLQKQSTLSGEDLEDYQKVTVLSPDGTLLAVAGAHDFSLLSYPSLQPVSTSTHVEKEIYDVAFVSNTLVVTTTHSLQVYELPTSSQPSSPSRSKSKKGKGKAANGINNVSVLSLKKTVDVPSASVGEGGTFRAIRIHPSKDDIVYTLINTVAPRSRQKKGPSRQGYVVKWKIDSWSVEKSRKIGDKGITCFDISPDGRYIGFGSSDLSVGMVDTTTLAPVATILKAHEFPPTFVRFNPSSAILVSGSADSSLRVISIPQGADGPGFSLILLAIMIIILAFIAQAYLKP
ncbi:WD40 repeat-like protein [Coprinopsis marcescibilis]|uniref:WD40 repeat-like protein n=1 Tax=Coprinopsis marcescibilis TaxID=230819 RepID=A0A5C3L9E4_COPMA|nr:WD40 repeat-like protein [Coprinopsis marcescibilis]